MHNAHSRFTDNIRSALELSALYDYAVAQIRAPMSFDDILRAQVVYAMSAFDKLMHDLIRLGMLQTFSGMRPATPKYLGEGISMDALTQIRSATVPPPEHFFEQEILKKHKSLSFQDPTKVTDGLSFIWLEQHKWQAIAASMGIDPAAANTRLKTICDRRNKIVHEADFDPITGGKYPITKADSEGVTQFLKTCGDAIYNLVR